MAAKKPGPTKPKARRVPSDDCILIQDGEEYAIHAGEWVEFRGRPKMGFLRKYLTMQSMVQASQAGTLSAEDAVVMGEAAEMLGEAIARHVSAWTWTDDEGELMPLPKDGDALDDLDQVEFQWLLEKLLETDGDRPNVSLPSTSA